MSALRYVYKIMTDNTQKLKFVIKIRSKSHISDVRKRWMMKFEAGDHALIKPVNQNRKLKKDLCHWQ
ncbi:hypothetical protein ASV53_14195 [Photobacterium sanguinicancri]|uniref:Uncharacterized protein n=1 Tax=Photobacterium sanguinicancri TaxID=875932 RepID=A0ABX4FY19_9GAMM|nr:hypothetical protein ASV53_14195 [Photobacterium sanguinicancri]